MEKVKNDYINENDDLNNFLTEVCKKNPNGFVYHNDLYSDFKKQYDKNISAKAFTQIMMSKRYVQKKKKDGHGFLGLNLKWL